MLGLLTGEWHPECYALTASQSGFDETPALGERVEETTGDGPAFRVADVSAKLLRQNNISIFPDPLQTSLCLESPVAADVAGQSRQEVVILSTQRISQRGKRTELDSSVVGHADLEEGGLVEVGDFLVVLARGQDHPLVKSQ
jgi:hypothetical protein